MTKLVDQTDRKILNELQKNARISIQQLSKIVNLSGPAVSRRIQFLEDSGIITGYKATINASKLGLGMTGYIIVSVQKLELSRFLNYVNEIDEIVSCETIIAGGKELIMRVACRNAQHLMTIYDRLPFSFIDDMTAYLVLEPPNKDDIIHLEAEEEKTD